MTGGATPCLETSRDHIRRSARVARDRAAGPPAQQPFKQIACVDIRRLCRDLWPAALKVWLYHLGRSDKRDSSWAKLETTAAETGLHSSTVKIARGWLRANGWLELVGHEKCGSASIPKLRCVLPGPKASEPGARGMVQKTPSVGSRRLKKTPWARVQKTPSEVDLPEVHEKREVPGHPRQLSLAGFATPVFPIAKAISQDPAAEIAASSTAPCRSDSTPKTLTAPQARYAAIAKLASEAENLLRRRVKPHADADCREDLKQWAAIHNVPYDSDAISNAFKISEERIRESCAGLVLGSDRTPEFDLDRANREALADHLARVARKMAL